TVDDAIDLLKEIPHRHSFSYPLLDATGTSAVVEASPRNIAVHNEIVCTNHFIKLTEENRYRMDDSIRRQQEMSEQQATVINSFDAFKMMNNSERGAFSTNYGAWSGTIHTAIYYPATSHTGFARCCDRLPYMMKFAASLQGKNLNVKRINGRLNTTIPFVNMTKLWKIHVIDGGFTMKIEIGSDFVCPFCYIGKRRLEQALELFPEREHVSIEFKSFQLDPHATSYQGEDYFESLAKKFGSIERAREMTENIKKIATITGLDLHFDSS